MVSVARLYSRNIVTRWIPRIFLNPRSLPMSFPDPINGDIQSWWEVPSIAHFCSLFRVAFNLLDFDIEELEEALLTDGTELNGNSLLQDLIVRLLCGCLGHNGISTFNYQMFLRRLFRTKCKEQGRENPFNTDVDFQFLPLRTKVEILHALCDFRLDAEDVIDVLKNLDSDSLRVHPLGYDGNRSAYWYFYGTRLYKEEFPKKRKKKKDHDKSKKKRRDKSSSSSDEDLERHPTGSWRVMCYSEDDWRELTRSMAGSAAREERALYTVLSEDFLPEIPRLFEEKEKLQRKRLAEAAPRRASRRLARQEEQGGGRSGERYSERERVNKEKMEQRQRQARGGRRHPSETDTEEDTEDSLLSDSGGSLIPPAYKGRQTNNSLSSAAVLGEIFSIGGQQGQQGSGDTSRHHQQPSSQQPPPPPQPQQHKFDASQLFRRTREDLMTGMYKILDTVKAHEDAWPFRDPVNEDYAPKYYSVIAKPMDLQTMEDKLDNGEYGSLQQFKADFQLIVDNCRQYNGSDNEYTEMVRRLADCFESSISRYLEQRETDEMSEDGLHSPQVQAPPLPPPPPHPPSAGLRPSQDYLSSDDSSMSPLDRPLSRSSSPQSSLDSETKENHFSSPVKRQQQVKEESFLNRDNKVDKSQLRKKQRRHKKNSHHPQQGRGRQSGGLALSGGSEAGSSPEEEDDLFKEKAGGGGGRRGRRELSTDLKSSSSRDTSKERSRGGVKTTDERSRQQKKVRLKRKSVLTKTDRSGAAVGKSGCREESSEEEEEDPSSSELDEGGGGRRGRHLPDLDRRRRGRAGGGGRRPPAVVGRGRQMRPHSGRTSSSVDSSKERPSGRGRVNYRESRLSTDSSETDELFTDTSDDSHFESKLKSKINQKKPVKKAGVIKDLEVIEALEQATEETLQDINRWLEDTPRFSDYSSCSNSPLHLPAYLEDMAVIEGEYRRRMMLDKPHRPRDRFSNDLHRRRIFKEQMGLKRRKEIQRTIDRLQPGKGKGNLLSKENHQNHVDGSGAEAKSQANENDENAPKISLGKVLPSDLLSFGIGESTKKESDDDCQEDKLVVEDKVNEAKEEKPKDEVEVNETKVDSVEVEKSSVVEAPEPKKEKPTPNLSAWFKAFGAPKAQPLAKKKNDTDENKTKEEETEEEKRLNVGTGVGSPARRQRKASTGSTVSERSSFSVDPLDGNSPRNIDEPYVSPQQEMKMYHHSPINGTIKVGFYQDTCFPRGTSEKSSSPRDPTGCSPRDLPSVSPRQPTAFSPRDYPNASPRSPYCSPSRHHPHGSPPPREYLTTAGSSPRRELPPSPSPRDYPGSPLLSHPHDYPASPRPCVSPKEPAPLSPYASPHPSHAPPIYSHYPPHLAAYYESNKLPEYRNAEKPPMSSYPVKKRAYSEVDSSKPSESPVYKSGGGSFTPTREAMEQERTFTPTPGRMPGPSQSIRVPSPLTVPLPHALHYADPYGDERRLASPYYAGGAASPRPIYPQPTGVLPANYRRDPREDLDRQESYQSSRPSTPGYPGSPHPDSQRSRTPLVGYSSRPSTPAHDISPSSTPINYSNANPDPTNKLSSPSPIINRTEDLSSPLPSHSHSKPELSSRKVDSPASSISYTSTRYNDVLPPKVSSAYNRTLPEIPLNYAGQDLSKLSVPLNYGNQSELLSAKMNYNHPMADLMQSTAARYNYQMSELMQTKAAVYNHPMQDFMQGKAAAAAAYSNLASFANRPISEIMQSKVSELQAREMAYCAQQRTPVSAPKAEPPPAKPVKKSRKKKTVTTEVPSSGFQQYVAPNSEPISLKSNTSVVPGSAFNFGPQLKESYGQYLDDIRSSYFAASHPETGSSGGSVGSGGGGGATGGKSNPGTPPYFLGHASSRTPPTAYPHHPFMSPQYQQFLQRHPEELLRPMMLHHQSLLPHHAAPGYPHGYLGMHDAINRPSWL